MEQERKKRTIAVLGGDGRQRYAAEHLRRMGYSVRTWGLSPEDTPDWRAALPADGILLPLPATADSLSVATPLCPQLPGLRFSALIDSVKPGSMLFGGRLPQAWERDARAHGLTVFDYSEDEAFQMRNVLPTVEGALLLALQTLPKTLCGTTVAVTGYGRIASLLADRLRALGAETVVFARCERDLAAARIRGHRPCRLRSDAPIRLPQDCRMVFNTVPAPIFGPGSLEQFPRGCVYLELASLPGGIDLRAAGGQEIRVLHGGGLPGRCFPESAGIIVAETVLAHLPTSNGKEGPTC